MSNYYHGSKTKITGYLEPRPSGVIDGEKAVFATNNKALALIYVNKWDENNIELGAINNNLFCREKAPGAFNVLKGGGYIYELQPSYFSTDKRLGMKAHEFISKKKVPILKTTVVKNALSMMRKSSITMISFDDYLDFIESKISKT
jgi:hypothetical protein